MITMSTALSVWLLLIVSCSAQNKSSCSTGDHSVPNRYPNPDPRAPDRFVVEWTTTASISDRIVLEIIRQWSPLGVDRFYQLILDNFYTCAAFFRVVPDFVVQFGIASNPNETLKWNTTIADDPVLESNTRTSVSYATAGPDTRTSQIFINTANNSRLDALGFSPFGRVIEGMDVVEKLYNPTPNNSNGVDQGNYMQFGNPWILEQYPDIDLIWTSYVYDPSSSASSSSSDSSDKAVGNARGDIDGSHGTINGRVQATQLVIVRSVIVIVLVLVCVFVGYRYCLKPKGHSETRKMTKISMDVEVGKDVEMIEDTSNECLIELTDQE